MKLSGYYDQVMQLCRKHTFYPNQNLSGRPSARFSASHLECCDFGVQYKRESESEIFTTLSFGAYGKRYRTGGELPIRHCRGHSPWHFDTAKSPRATGLRRE